MKQPIYPCLWFDGQALAAIGRPRQRPDRDPPGRDRRIPGLR